jgi:hypothetical protein
LPSESDDDRVRMRSACCPFHITDEHQVFDTPGLAPEVTPSGHPPRHVRPIPSSGAARRGVSA